MERLTDEQVAVRAKWTAALRSGRYEQGVQYLNNYGKFCCLGVLCEELGVDKYKPALGPTRYEGYASRCPTSAERAVGIYGGSGALCENDTVALTALNDCYRLTFDEIADVIDLDTMMRQDGAL